MKQEELIKYLAEVILNTKRHHPVCVGIEADIIIENSNFKNPIMKKKSKHLMHANTIGDLTFI